MLQKVGLPALADGALLKTDSFIDGAWVPAASGARFAVHNPADGLKLAEVANAGPAEAAQAIAAAAKAMPAWRGKTAKERAAVLRRWFELILASQEDLATLMTAEQGKPLAESRGEIVYGASFIEWFAEEAKRVYGDTIPTVASRQAASRAEAADRRGRRDHAVELPERDDHAQGRRRRSRPAARSSSSPPSRRRCRRSRWRSSPQRAGIPAGVFNVVTADESDSIGVGKVLCEPRGAQAVLHRIDRGRPHPAAAERADR